MKTFLRILAGIPFILLFLIFVGPWAAGYFTVVTLSKLVVAVFDFAFDGEWRWSWDYY